MDKTEDKTLYTSVSAVLETLGDEQNVRVALLFPHTARKLVRESVDSEGTGILSNLTDSILVDLPFRNLLYESRKVQRLYYELDKKDVDLYGKSNTVTNSLLLIDPIRLLYHLKMDMNQAQRSLFMRCFSPKIWIIFLRLVSLGVGSRMRDLYSLRKKKTTSDKFLRDLESFQISLVEMVLQVTSCDPGVHTPFDIEKSILNGCKNMQSFAEKLKDTWGNHLDETPILNELIPYLNKCVNHINFLLHNEGKYGTKDFCKLEPDSKQEQNNVSLFYQDGKPVISTGSRGFHQEHFNNTSSNIGNTNDNTTNNNNNSNNSLNYRDNDNNFNTSFPNNTYSQNQHYLVEGQNFPDLDTSGLVGNDSSVCKRDSNYYNVLKDIRKALVSVATKSATLISLMKLKILEQRQKEFETPGSFDFIDNEVLRKGFTTCSFDEYEAVSLLMLSHCLGAYSLREWVIRFLVDVKLDQISQFLNDKDNLSVNSYGVKESAYFRTAGQTNPKLGDYFTLVPPELKTYMKKLSNLK